jgi:hypothetical protein
MTQEHIQALHAELEALRAELDMLPAHPGSGIHDVIRDIETEIAWHEHRARHGNGKEREHCE